MKKFLKTVKREALPVLLPSVFTGTVVGIAVFLFKVAAEFAVEFSKAFYTFALRGVWQGAVCLSAVIALAFCVFLIAKKFPFSKGGGIPFAVYLSKLKTRFGGLGTFFATFISSVITFFVAVPLGTEGPSVSLGALCGCKFSKDENKSEIISAAAGAGFCAATGSAIGGFLFSIEEMKGKIKARQITASLLCTLLAYVLSSFLCGIFGVHFFLFEKVNVKTLPGSLMFLPLLAGVLCGAAAILFTKFAVRIRKFFLKFRLPKIFQILIIFILVFFTAIFFGEATGSGLELTKLLFTQNLLWSTLVALIILRCLFLVFSNSVGVTGGMFLPLLALGALMGALCLLCLTRMGVNTAENEIYFVLLFMAAFVGAVNKMPFTVTAFLCETVCGFCALLPVLAAALISFGVFSLFCKKDLTEKIVEELSEKNKEPLS